MSYPASVGVAREGDVATEGLGWTLRRGATVLPNSVTFSVWAPNATSVSAHVATGDAAGDHPLLPSKTERGVWETSVAKVRAGDRYGYRLDGVEPLPDPVSRSQPDGVHALSEVVDPGAIVWTDDAWRGVALADFVIYEIHVGAFTAEGTFEAAAARLNELVALGITAIELMPVASFPGRRNWGYDGVHLYAPQLSYGGVEGLQRFVNAAHAHGIGVVLDVVYNFGSLSFLEELSDEVHALGRQLGRKVQLMAESDLNDPRPVRARAGLAWMRHGRTMCTTPSTLRSRASGTGTTKISVVWR